jgi:hypothetical protein
MLVSVKVFSMLRKYSRWMVLAISCTLTLTGGGCASRSRPVAPSPISLAVAQQMKPMRRPCSKSEARELVTAPREGIECTVLAYSGNTVLLSWWDIHGVNGSEYQGAPIREVEKVVKKRVGKKYVQEIK